MPLVQRAPQRVEHTDGWSVSVADRFDVQYKDELGRVLVSVEFGDLTLYLMTDTYREVGPHDDTDALGSPLSPERAALVASRVEEGMAALMPNSTIERVLQDPAG